MPCAPDSVRPHTMASPARMWRNSRTKMRPFSKTGTQSMRLSSANSHVPSILKYSG